MIEYIRIAEHARFMETDMNKSRDELLTYLIEMVIQYCVERAERNDMRSNPRSPRPAAPAGPS